MDLGVPRAQELARALLLTQKPARLPIRVEHLRFDKPLVIDSIGHYLELTGDTLDRLCAGDPAALRDGCTLVRWRKGQKIYIILYNERVRCIRRRSFTLAHEVGHIYLGHDQDGRAWEQQANAFAAELLMPRILAAHYLRMLGSRVEPSAALAQVFAVSRSVSDLHIRRCVREEAYTDQESKLLARYRTALPDPNEPQISY